MKHVTPPKRMSPVSVSDWQTRLTPGGKPMYQRNEARGGYHWTQAATDELTAMVSSGMMTKDIAAAFGLNPPHIRSKIHKVRKSGTDISSPRRIKYDRLRNRIIHLAPEADGFTSLARRLGCSVTLVVETMKEHAPEHHARLARPECSPKANREKPEPIRIDWTSRANALFPGDEALARSLARAASFVAKTRDGVTVRIVPPRSEGAAA